AQRAGEARRAGGRRARHRARLGKPGERQHARDVTDVLVADAEESVVEVVVPVRQVDAGNGEAQLVTIRIDAVRTDIEAERRTGAFPPGTAESFDEIRPRADALDGRELRPQRLDADRVQHLHVHVSRALYGVAMH